MKFVAAARLRRAQARAISARPYAAQIARVLRSTMARIESPGHPLMARRDEAKILTVVLTGERGLCGAFNANILRKAVEFLRAHRERKLFVIPVRKKGPHAFRNRTFSFLPDYLNIPLTP